MRISNLASKKEQIGMAINRKDNGLHPVDFYIRANLNKKEGFHEDQLE